MNKINRLKFLSAILVLAYVLSACSGVPAGAQQPQAAQQSGEPQQVVFSGTVQSMGGGQWTVSSQSINLDGKTKVGADVVVGSNVRVEAVVNAQGLVTARSIELAVQDNSNVNSNSNINNNSSNANDVNANTNTNVNVNDNSTNANGNTNDNGTMATGKEQEIVGTVQSLQNGSITINGVTYSIANFTEFKDTIAAGDQVKVHVIVNADGTFTIREIEKVTQTTVVNSNTNSNGSDDNGNTNTNTNVDDHGGSNSNGDHGNDNNDDHGNDNGGNGGGG